MIAYKTKNNNNDNGILFSSGLITGEAIMGILIALPIFISGNTNWWGISFNMNIIGIIAFIYVMHKLKEYAQNNNY